MHDCFAIELTGECLKCFIRLTRDVPAVVVQSEALWARIPEIQVRIPSRAMGTFFPHTVSSIFLFYYYCLCGDVRENVKKRTVSTREDYIRTDTGRRDNQSNGG